jgi:hypothetical protein
MGGGISCSFDDENIKLSTASATSVVRFPQAALDYKWFAW